MKKLICFVLVFTFTFNLALIAQTEVKDNTETEDLANFDPFADGSDKTDQRANFSVNLGGTISTGGTFFFNDFKRFKDTRISSLVWGNLHVRAKAPLTEAYFGIKVNDMTLPFNFKNKPDLYPKNPQIPRIIDEAYFQASIAAVTFGGGIKKLTWGKADAFSVLDVINSQDLSNPSISDMKEIKLARPMFYLSAYLPKEMKLELVYLPIFEGSHFATSGRWKPNQFKDMGNSIMGDAAQDPNFQKVMQGLFSKPDELKKLQTMMSGFTGEFTPGEIDSAKLKYSQAGLRYTATIAGYHDIGIQYYYGFLAKPAFSVDSKKISGSTADEIIGSFKKAITMDYNPYHQIGLDYALAIGPINLRAELAANITYDIKGTKANTYNPSMAWNLGLDYKTPFGLSLNFCASENIKLMHKKIGTELYDIEKGSKTTDTKLMLLLSQALLRDSINVNLRTIMACETLDFMMVPSVDWTFGTLFLKAELGFFFGKENGLFSQYKDNNYISLMLSYSF